MASRKVISGVTVECVQGNIIGQDGDAVVNAANARLLPGGGVAGAIHAAAGPELERETRPLAPIEPGQAVVTSGQRLPNRYIIHCLGPVYGVDMPSDELLADCYRNALRLAEEHGIESVAFPAISTGAFGYPVEEAAPVSIAAVAEVAPTLETVRLIRFVLHDDADLQAFERALEETG